MDTSNRSSGADSNASLLEGLYQLTLSGQTGSGEFDLIEHEVYTRLLAAYQGSDDALPRPLQ